MCTLYSNFVLSIKLKIGKSLINQNHCKFLETRLLKTHKHIKATITTTTKTKNQTLHKPIINLLETTTNLKT